MQTAYVDDETRRESALGLTGLTLLMAGGSGHRTAADDAALIRWLREQALRARRAGAVCTGAFMLAGTGLLDDRRATTHWRHAGQLARRHPRVQRRKTLVAAVQAEVVAGHLQPPVGREFLLQS